MLKIYYHIVEYYMIVKSGIRALYARDYYPIVFSFSLDEGITSLLIGDNSYSGDSDCLNVFSFLNHSVPLSSSISSSLIADERKKL